VTGCKPRLVKWSSTHFRDQGGTEAGRKGVTSARPDSAAFMFPPTSRSLARCSCRRDARVDWAQSALLLRLEVSIRRPSRKEEAAKLPTLG
jgi:hypothetical protein